MRPGLAATDLVDLASLIYFSISYLPKHTSGTCTVSNTETTPSILHGKTHTPEHGVYRAPLLPEGAPGQPRAGAHEASPTGAPRTPAAQFLPLVGRHPLHALHRTTFMLPQASTAPQCTCSWTCSLHWPRTSHHSVQIPSQASLLACMPRPAHVWTTPRTAPPGSARPLSPSDAAAAPLPPLLNSLPLFPEPHPHPASCAMSCATTCDLSHSFRLQRGLMYHQCLDVFL